jgi:2',3'-cyclic-nucleotide 2'-phosphodiesterase (5'-nucleotidase family)
LNPAGGLARRAWLFNQLKTVFPKAPFLALDSGNFSDNPNEEGELRTRVLLEGMAQLGYRAVNVGERDLALGYDDFVKNVDGIGLEFVSANIVKQGTREPVFKPWTIVEVKPPEGGSAIKVGVIGVVRFNPVWQKAGPAGSNLGLAPPLEMVKKYLPDVRAKSDIVVLLSALGRDDAGRIAREAPGIDFVLGSYGGIYNANEETEGAARLFYTGNQGRRVGETRLFLDAARKLSSSTTFLHELSARYPDDATMRAFVERGNGRIAALKGAAAPGTH